MKRFNVCSCFYRIPCRYPCKKRLCSHEVKPPVSFAIKFAGPFVKNEIDCEWIRCCSNYSCLCDCPCDTDRIYSSVCASFPYLIYHINSLLHRASTFECCLCSHKIYVGKSP